MVPKRETLLYIPETMNKRFYSHIVIEKGGDVKFFIFPSAATYRSRCDGDYC